MSPERIDELIALAALGELSPEDERDAEALRRADPAFAVEFDEAVEAAAELQRGLAESPPSGLRADVLAAVASTPQEASGTVSIDAARQRRWRRSPFLLAAAAAVVFVVGALVVANDVAAPDPIDAVVDAEDAQRHSVAGELGVITATYSPSEEALVLQGDDIATVAADQTYQLWFDVDGEMVSAGLFRPDGSGHVEELISVPAGTGESINVTAEPAGGSASPTLPVLASSA